MDVVEPLAVETVSENVQSTPEVGVSRKSVLTGRPRTRPLRTAVKSTPDVADADGGADGDAAGGPGPAGAAEPASPR